MVNNVQTLPFVSFRYSGIKKSYTKKHAKTGAEKGKQTYFLQLYTPDVIFKYRLFFKAEFFADTIPECLETIGGNVQ